MAKLKKSEYSAKDIFVLKGLDPVRKRPGMYIGSTGVQGLHHLVWECTDNSLDEAMGGYADEIEINLLPDNYVSVSDNGRGIPVDIHKETKKSALETVMTTLHAGAKFGKKTYQVSGGLHGVGVSVVCALSSELKAEVSRDGYIYSQEFSKGKAKGNVKKGQKCSKNKTGTKITFKPDKDIFETLVFDKKTILNHLRRQAHLTKGVKIIFKDLRDKENKFNYVFYFEGGLGSYIKYLCGENEPIHENTFYISKMVNDILVEVAFQYTQERETYEESFANNIYTAEGGTHITGFRTALTRAVNEYAKNNDYLKKDEEVLNGKDVRVGINAAVSIKLKEPQFEGQTKAKLGNPEAKSAVETITYEALMEFLERYSSDARAIIQNSLLAAKARRAASAARRTVLRKGILEGLTLPGKLSDCSSKKPEESELFIVEGQSAGGSCKGGRDRKFQAVLPLRGKILNVERAALTRMLSSDEIKALVIALGTAIAQDFDLSNLRYHRIIIATDADSDGAHIRTLLLTLFFRYFKPIIEKGYLYIARPPLYKIQLGRRVEYAYNELDRKEIVEDMKKEKLPKIKIQRYKGLGEMNADQLWETTMNPENRILLRVAIEDAKEADKMFDTLMGKEVASRKKFIQAHAKSAKNLDI
jgi:DNA gyrase subunit B